MKKVAVTVVARWRNRSVQAIWQLQLYTLLSLMFAAVIGRIRGELSIFHEIAAARLAMMSYFSALVARMLQIEVKDDVSDAFHLFKILAKFLRHLQHIRSERPGFYNLRVFVHKGYDNILPCIWLATCMDNPCVSNPYEPNSSGIEHLTWVILFAWPLHGGVIFIAAILDVIIGVFMVFIPISIGFEWKGVEGGKVGLVAGFYIFWVHEVICLESTLRANTGLNHEAEEFWGFGQVSLSVYAKHLKRIPISLS